MRKAREIFYNVLEYVLAFMFIRGGANILFFGVEPIVLPGILAYLVGEFAILGYGIMFLLTGLALLYAKWFKKKGLHKFVLLFMYLTCIYVLVLAIMINGLGWNLLITVAVGVTAAALWIRWKFKTEYISSAQFEKEIEELIKE